MQAEVLAQNAVGVIGAEDPVIEFGDDPALWFGLGKKGRFGGDQHFARADAFEQAGQFGEVDFGGAEFAGGDIDVGEAGARAVARDSCEVIVFVRAEQVRVGRGARRDDAGDFAAHQLLAGTGLFDLIADGHAIAASDEARDVAFGRVIGDAAHRDGGAFFLVARGEGDFEFARGE